MPTKKEEIETTEAVTETPAEAVVEEKPKKAAKAE